MNAALSGLGDAKIRENAGPDLAPIDVTSNSPHWHIPTDPHRSVTTTLIYRTVFRTSVFLSHVSFIAKSGIVLREFRNGRNESPRSRAPPHKRS